MNNGTICEKLIHQTEIYTYWVCDEDKIWAIYEGLVKLLTPLIKEYQIVSN